jgi:stringent starvation protein B
MPAVSLGPDQTGSLTNVVVNSASATISAPVGVPGKVIRVYRIVLVVGGTTNITFQDGNNAVSGPFPMVANGSIVLDIDGTAWYATSLGNDFVIANSGTVQVSGNVYYQLSNA